MKKTLSFLVIVFFLVSFLARISPVSCDGSGTFGKTDIGSSNGRTDEYGTDYPWITGVILGSIYYLSDDNVTVDSIHYYGRAWEGMLGFHWYSGYAVLTKCVIYDNATLEPKVISYEQTIDSNLAEGYPNYWWNYTIYSAEQLDHGWYFIAIWWNLPSIFYYESGAGGQFMWQKKAYTGTFPDPLVPTDPQTWNMSIYASYTFTEEEYTGYLSIMSIFGLMGFFGAIATPAYAAWKMKNHEYHGGFVTGVILESVFLGLLAAWLSSV